MTVEEVIAIKHKMSLETASMTAEERRVYYSEGAAKAQAQIDAYRAEREANTVPAKAG